MHNGAAKMKIIKVVWLSVFLLGFGFFLLFALNVAALSVIDGPKAQHTAILLLLLSLVSLGIGLGGYFVFDRKAASRSI